MIDFFSNKQQVRRLALVCAGVALLVVLITLLIVFFSGNEPPEDQRPSSGTSFNVIPEGMRLYDDLYEGQVIIPDFDVPDNKYDMNAFKTGGDGFLEYKDAALGIAVSEFQGNIDWYAVKAAGVEFAIIRLGYRGMTQGVLNLDQNFAENLAGASDAGLQLGVYFFSQAVTAKEGEAEAKFVLEQLEGKKLDYPVVFDWEDPVPSEDLPAETLRALNCPGETVTAAAKSFCETIKEGGYTPCVYFNKHQAYYFYDLDVLKDYEFWYAEYNPRPAVCYHFRTWQYSDQGTVPGIETTVDMNLCFEPRK